MAEKLDINGNLRQQRQGSRADRVGGSVRAFTLIELLVVIALTGLLLALVLGPLIQGFRLTNRARAFATAQDATRFAMEHLRRELQQASYVFDNTNTPIILPLDNANPAKMIRDKNYYPGGNARPSILYAKIDFIPTATQGVGGDRIVIDPTTNRPLGGSPLSLPAAPGQHYVRYFIGLRSNLPATDGTPAFYHNIYEFPRTDSGPQDFNSFVLYRAEYDPRDANLINQDPNSNPYAIDGGGLHDPDFFYNKNAARNGKSYAENWKTASSPVLSSPNLDLLIWRRDIGRQVDTNTPFQLAVQFTPSTVLSDALTPGFISNTAAETPGAVPSLYTAQYGQWTYPFTITVYRASTQYNPSRPRPNEPYSSVSFTIGPNGPEQRLQVTVPATNPAAGFPFRDVNQNARQNFYWLLDSQTGKIFIFTQNLSFQLDPARGRIETAFPSLATDPSGIPLYVDPDGGMQALNRGPNGNFGTLVPTIFRQQTLDQANAGRQIDPTATGSFYVPLNQGILGTDLSASNYYLATAPIPAFTNHGQAFDSPFVSMGGAADNPATSYRGIMIVPGSEKVMGPDNNITLDANNNPVLTTYYRISTVTSAPGTLAKLAGVTPQKDTEAGTLNAVRYYTRTAQLNYDLEFDLSNYRAPKLKFDEPGIALDNAAGLPALPLNDAAAANANELRVSFLWQNNYSRNTVGQPLNVDGNATIGNLDDPTVNQTNPITGVIQKVLKNPTQSAVRPEADVIRADYSTRSLVNVVMGARVYDSTTGTPQTAQITDKLVIGNIPR
jgi:prepilin-type N-terminal cleavage/methylation domain-containing protein